MTGAIHIVELKREWETHAWLCDACISMRKSKEGGGWTAKVLREVAGRCDDCTAASQAAPGYVTPTMTYVPTAPGSFCPPPEWVAPAPIAPWPKPARKGRAQQQPIAEEEAA